MSGKKSKLSVRDLCFIGIFVAIIAVLTQVTIPLPGGVPFTLQTFAIPLAAIVLGAKKGVIAAMVYLLLGSIGAPVFAGALIGNPSGIHRLIGPWGGYLLSYPLVMLIVGKGAESENKEQLALFLALGVIVNLTMGTLQFYLFNLLTPGMPEITLQAAFLAGFAPFILIEIAKMVLAFIVGLQVRKILMKFQ